MQYPHGALIEAINDKGDNSRLDNVTYSVVFALPREEKEEYLKEGWFGYPKEFEKYLLEGPIKAEDYEGDALMTAYDNDQYTLGDVTGICYWWQQFWTFPPVNSRTLIADLISATTGMEIDEAGVTRIARRIVNLVRAYNLREGMTREDDMVPKIAFERASATTAYGTYKASDFKTLDRTAFDKRIDKFYEIKGWTSEGIPTKETLEGLGLDYVRQDLERRGILTG
jgi:aldehyde:ferredoxin oxidoreductase